MRSWNTIGRKRSASVLHKSVLEALETRRHLDGTYHPLASGPFSQNWDDVNQITTNDDWSGVPSIIGYLSGLGTSAGGDPQTITGTSTQVDVNANQTNPVTFQSGGVTEFELENPTIALAGSNSAGSPYIVIHLDTTNIPSVDIAYNVRDLDSSADNAVQRVALHYRINPSAPWINVPEAYIADATLQGSATLVTPVAVTLPAETAGQSQLEVRIITGNASGNDEPVGIDDIVVQETPVVQAPGNFQLDPAGLRINEDAGTAVVTVTRQGGAGGVVTVDYATSDLTAIAGLDYAATTGTLTFVDGQTTADIVIPLLADSLDELAEQFSVTLSNPTGGASLNPTISNIVTIVDADGHRLSEGAFEQNWNNIDLITSNDDWNQVYNIIGYASDADRDAGLVDVIANQFNPATQSQGGVAEFDGIADPTIALQGSNAAAAPQIIIDLNTLNLTGGVNVSFDAIDLDSSVDNAAQPISVSYRIGNAGDFFEFYFLEDATEGPSLAGLVNAISIALPSEAIGHELVQLRIATTNVAGNDEWVGIDNIRIAADSIAGPAPVLNNSVFEFEVAQAMQLTFSQDVAASLSVSDIQVTNITTSQVLASSAYTIETSTVGGVTVARVVFGNVLQDGNYELRVLAGSISAAGGASNDSDLVSTFYVLAGDANRDRSVNFDDLLILAQNYGQAGRTFSAGNFDYSADGLVSFDDLLILAQKYNASIPAIQSAPLNASFSEVRVSQSAKKRTDDDRPARAVLA